MIFTNSLGLVNETLCSGCGWPVCSCLCEADDLIDWQARAEAAEATLASCNRARQAAEAECEWLRQELATVAADVKLMLRTPHNHDWLASGDCPRCAIEQRLIANTTPARQRSSGGAVDDD